MSEGVNSTFRPVHSTAIQSLPGRDPADFELEGLFSLRGRRDPELFAILRDGAPGDLDPLRAQLLHDSSVRVRTGRILIRDDFRDLALDRERRDFAALRRVDAAV